MVDGSSPPGGGVIVDDRETIRVHGPHIRAPPVEVGIMGSCASFFGFLLIATIGTLFELGRAGLPGANITEVFVLIPAQSHQPGYPGRHRRRTEGPRRGADLSAARLYHRPHLPGRPCLA